MQTNHFTNLPLIIFMLPDNYEFACVRWCAFFLGIIMKFVHSHFNGSITFNGINFHTTLYQFPGYLTTDIFLSAFKKILFGCHQPTLIVIKPYAVRINCCLFVEVTNIIRFKKNTIKVCNGIK